MPPSGERHFELHFRSRRILYAAITEYIATGQPVGSRTLARRYGLNLSAASIRNVLADLEETGYLSQPHASAGRVPTDRGFRVFVDALVQMREVAAQDRETIVQRLKGLQLGKDDVMREAGVLLSSLTGAAALVSPPRLESAPLLQLRFLPLRPRTYLAVLVLQNGAVQNRIVDFGDDIDPQALERVHNYLGEQVTGRSLRQIREHLAQAMDHERDHYQRLRRTVQALLDATLADGGKDPEVIIEGQGRLFDLPEFADVDKIRAFLRTFEEKERLLALLDQTLRAGGVHVLIGSETQLSEVQDISVICANYHSSDSASGSLGVIGPARMDYGKIVPLVGFTARVVGEVLHQGGDDEDAAD
ncbi:MAG: heat-inducible transcriptional repressor HrcA [Polyangiales bacterium]